MARGAAAPYRGRPSPSRSRRECPPAAVSVSSDALLDVPPAIPPAPSADPSALPVPPADADTVCPSCGAPRPRRHCPECGEARVEPEELTLRHFAAQAVEQVTSVDGTLGRTLRTLLLRPGELTVEYFAGRRRRYAKPLQLFLLTNVAVLLFLQLAGIDMQRGRRTLAMYEAGRVEAAMVFDDGRLVKRVVELRRTRTRLTPAAFATRFDARRAGMGQTAWLLAVPLVAGALAVLYVRRREPFLRHLVCATHLSAFLSAGAFFFAIAASLMTIIVRWSVPRWSAAGVNATARVAAIRDDGFDVLGIVMAAWLAVYLFLALRRVYAERWGWTLVRTVVLFLVVPFMIVALFNDVSFLLALVLV